MFHGHPAVGVLASLTVGILLTYLVTVLRRWFNSRLRSRSTTTARKSSTFSRT